MLKVGVWGPGSMGVIALRGVIDHPQLQLVDLVVHSDAKAGRDAGELCGAAAVGVLATQDPAAMLAGDADVVVYAAAANLRPLEAVADMVALLRAGKNVVSCSVVPLVFPDAVDAAFTDPLRDAALAGGVVVLHHRHRQRIRQRCSAAGSFGYIAGDRKRPRHGDVQLRHLSGQVRGV